MPDYSSTAANHPTSAPLTLPITEAHDGDGTDRDAATPENYAGAHARKLANEVVAISLDVRAHAGLYCTDGGSLDVDYTAGSIRFGDGAPVDVAASSVTVADDDTSYIECDSAGSVTDNITGFTNGQFPIATVVAASGVISTITQDRTAFYLHDDSATDHGSTGGLADDDHTQYLLADATRALTANWDAGGFTFTATQFISDIAIGTAPFVATSTTVVPNLNVDQVDGKDSTDFLLLDGTQAMAGNFDMSGGAYDILIPDNQAAALEFKEGANAYITLVSTDSAEKITVHKETTFNETVCFDAEFDNGNSGATDTIDWGVGNKQKSTLTDDCTFTFTAPNGPCSLILKLVQDGTGSRSPTWPGTVKWPASTEPTWSTAAAAIDIVAFYYDGTNYYGQAGRTFG